ncbi:MAG: hypothetical protein DA408_03470 [Bacteroidetes bacterium]|nr:MAG: hypothetical protein C7N36_00380 [Bacteroidota bacterium]PTM14346.1 MAG: hypothetical protein DA408_03470 [Bacteroidota bacterium]
MLRYLLLCLLALHGLIHLLGFVKAFAIAPANQLTATISKPMGLLWLVAAALLLVTTFLLMRRSGHWFWWAFLAIGLSQVLLILYWQETKFGTLPNLVLLLTAIVALSNWRFESRYQQDVAASLRRTATTIMDTIGEQDLAHLPLPVQGYLRYVGVVGQPKVNNFRATWTGFMREKGKDWFPFTAEQYNFCAEPERLFFMKAKLKGLSTYGYHAYSDGEASMLVKVLSLFPVVDLQEKELFKAETVTFFNDLCLLAPAALIDKNIQWETIDPTTVRAFFNNRDVTVSAVLHFNEEGQLINFVSDDRLEVASKQAFRFSTPLANYRKFGKFQLLGYGEAKWHYPEGEFIYGKFYLQDLTYNIEP